MILRNTLYLKIKNGANLRVIFKELSDHNFILNIVLKEAVL